ncbi:MAG: UDP-N-acetylglucosamine 1-carboxyvinyltransferase [bacterium]
MSKFIINGGQPLKGTIRVNGAKNAAVAIIAATVLIPEECIINEVPQISDVEKMLQILSELGAKVDRQGHQVKIDCSSIGLSDLNQKAVCAMRSAILLMGPFLARFKSIAISEPGGCLIGNRPLDSHFIALEALGAKISRDNGGYLLKTDGLTGANIILPEFSVTATENAIMAAVLAKGRTTIKLAAAEPHVQDLIDFLNQAGAKIKIAGTHILEIDGVEKLNGLEYTIIPDMIEAGTFAVAAAATSGQVRIENVRPDHLDIIILKLREAGVKIEAGDNYLLVDGQVELQAIKKLQTLPYPGFPSDLEAPFGVLATQCQGETVIEEVLYEGRLGYINELVKMGAQAVIQDPHRVLISGPTPLTGQECQSLDLRAGATMIIAGLTAQGQTIINEAQIIDRGYEKIEERLANLGADIKRID